MKGSKYMPTSTETGNFENAVVDLPIRGKELSFDDIRRFIDLDLITADQVLSSDDPSSEQTA